MRGNSVEPLPPDSRHTSQRPVLMRARTLTHSRTFPGAVAYTGQRVKFELYSHDLYHMSVLLHRFMLGMPRSEKCFVRTNNCCFKSLSECCSFRFVRYNTLVYMTGSAYVILHI